MNEEEYECQIRAEYIYMLDKQQEEIERLNTDKEQLNSLVNSCQEEIRRLNKIIERKNKRIQQLMKRTRSARIDKALELIYANAYDTEKKECVDDLWGSIEELVDILKGSDKK